MEQLDHLKEILDTEAVAREIIFNAQALRKERVEKAREEAERLIVETKESAMHAYKQKVRSAQSDSEKFLEKAKQEALRENENIELESDQKKKAALEHVMEGIIRYLCPS
jgi:vacuolar-type H+-ATPase subunit H